jgi:KaiC/GvpD/RAD55 family RecA-like ATPase
MPDINFPSEQNPHDNYKPGVDSKIVNYNNYNKKKISLEKHAVGHLPDDLVNFINNDSYSLLIKGKPGTGKTILALTLMDNLNHDSNYFYISTKLSIKQLFNFYPWINKFALKNTSNYEYKFEDARLDEPESLFERITNQLMDAKSPTIIIDTWDAVASFMDRESRLNNERILQIWRERAGAKLIFISETSDTHLLDSIVDGVVALNYEYEQTQYYRKLFCSKLRGIPINCSQYYYTLFNGFFFVFDSFSNLNIFKQIKSKNDYPYQKRFLIDKNKDYGYNRYQRRNTDTFIRFFNSKLVTLEFDLNINEELIISLLFRSLFYWLASKNLILISNFQWNLHDMLKEVILSFQFHKSLTNNLLNDLIDYHNLETIYNTYEKENQRCNGKKDNFGRMQDYIHEILSPILKNKNCKYDNILNIIDGNDIVDLISDIKYIDFIKKNPFNNIIILKKQKSIDTSVLLSKSEYYRIILKDSNILLQPNNSMISAFGALNLNKNYFIDWFPLY